MGQESSPVAVLHNLQHIRLRAKEKNSKSTVLALICFPPIFFCLSMFSIFFGFDEFNLYVCLFLKQFCFQFWMYWLLMDQILVVFSSHQKWCLLDFLIRAMLLEEICNQKLINMLQFVKDQSDYCKLLYFWQQEKMRDSFWIDHFHSPQSGLLSNK